MLCFPSVWNDFFICSHILTVCWMSASVSSCHVLFLSTFLRLTEDSKMNSSLSNFSGKCERDTRVTSVVFPCLYSLLFVAALVLNSLAAWIFFSIPSTSTFVVFLKNVVRVSLHTLCCKCTDNKSVITSVLFFNRWWLTCWWPWPSLWRS